MMRRFGEIASAEYRALGIATALSPQVDMATEPRWSRVSGTFGEDPDLVTDMSRAYVDGFQTSTGGKEIRDGWGYESVNAMVKHWPGVDRVRLDVMLITVMVNTLFTPERISRNKRSLLWKAPLNWMELPAKLLR